MKSQKEVTLRDDLELRDRLDIYRNFLLYCMSGDVVILPMGSTVVVERDSSEFARLSQLGDVLGLNPMEVNSVHSGLAEQSFRHQVQTVMGDGRLNKERSEALTGAPLPPPPLPRPTRLAAGYPAGADSTNI